MELTTENIINSLEKKIKHNKKEKKHVHSLKL